MTCSQIRQGRDGQADEDVEDYLSSLSPCRPTKAATSNEFGKSDWLGVLEKKSKPSALREWMNGRLGNGSRSSRHTETVLASQTRHQNPRAPKSKYPSLKCSASSCT